MDHIPQVAFPPQLPCHPVPTQSFLWTVTPGLLSADGTCPAMEPPAALPPPKPPPSESNPCPPGCLLDGLTCSDSPTTVIIDLCANQSLDSTLAELSPLPSITDSITHIVCSPRVCGIHGNMRLSITMRKVTTTTNQMIDGRSNVCVTGDLGSLLDVVDIKPITKSVALEGYPTLYNDCITKQGLLPLLLSDSTTYYQTCFYCANMVDTIISLAVVLASSDVFYSWTQEGFKDPPLLGSICFTSHDGLLSMFFPLSCRNGLYYCNTDVYTADQDPVCVHCQRTSAATSTTPQHQPASKFTPTTSARQVKFEVWALQFGSPGEGQLDVLPRHVDRMPSVFEYHPFCFVDFKE
jgi:hypothetical protein